MLAKCSFHNYSLVIVPHLKKCSRLNNNVWDVLTNNNKILHKLLIADAIG